jgi:hypothetical protein
MSAPLTPEALSEYIGKALPYINTAGKVSYATVCIIRETNGRNPFWFKGIDTKTGADVFYPFHTALSIFHQTAALREELEGRITKCHSSIKQQRETISEYFKAELSLKQELEAVKKERAAADKALIEEKSFHKLNVSIKMQYKAERDQAFYLLGTYNHLWTEPEYDKWNLLRQALLSSLENKHEFGIMQPGEPGAGGYDPNNPPPQIVYCHKCNNQLLEVIEYKKVNYCKNCGHQVLGESIQNNNI